jgi:hypothetical protein
MRIPMLAAALVLAAPITSCDRAGRSPRELHSTSSKNAAADARADVGSGAPVPAEGAVASDAEVRSQAEQLPSTWSDFGSDPARLVIRTGQAGIEVDSLEPALAALRALVGGRGSSAARRAAPCSSPPRARRSG